MQRKMYIKYFDDLKEGEPGILISGDVETLELLQNAFMQLFYKNTDNINISNLSFVKPIKNFQLIASVYKKNKGMKRENKDEFYWILTSSKWFEYAEKISELKKGPSHQYFDIESDDLLIIISNGEYSENWVGWTE